jgi:hypothetical protein
MQSTHPHCSIVGCDKPVKARAMCVMHYKRVIKHGDPHYTPPTPEDTFWGQIDRSDPDACWLWDRVIGTGGYGYHNWRGRTVRAHRVSVLIDGRTIPDGMQVDHTCRTRSCINPRHLEVVTPRENKRRGNEHSGIGQYKTHCPSGHPYDETNTYTSRNGARHCRACKVARTKEWRNDRRKSSRNGADAGG